MTSPCDRNCVWNYTVTKRTAKTITISDGTETKTCRVNTQVSEDRNAETIFPVGRYSMCPVLSADKEEMPEVQEPTEEAKAEAKVITLPRKMAMIKWVKVDQKTGERAKRGCNSLSYPGQRIEMEAPHCGCMKQGRRVEQGTGTRGWNKPGLFPFLVPCSTPGLAWNNGLVPLVPLFAPLVPPLFHPQTIGAQGFSVSMEQREQKEQRYNKIGK